MTGKEILAVAQNGCPNYREQAIVCEDCREAAIEGAIENIWEEAIKIAKDAIDPGLAGSEEAYANDVVGRIITALLVRKDAQ